MIVCPNCKHDNPEGATNCEACYTALPATKSCPSCGAAVQLDATFCGQCGHSLKVAQPILLNPPVETPPAAESSGLPPTVLTSPTQGLPTPNTPVVEPEPLAAPPDISSPVAFTTPPLEPDPVIVPPEIEQPAATVAPPIELAATTIPPIVEPEATIPPQPPTPATVEPEAQATTPPASTQIQAVSFQLLHLQTSTPLEIPPHLEVIAIGKPNESVPPDIDVSGFPCAEVVSRVHASLRKEGENYYIEDTGSANGTYINHNSLPKGNRHLLRNGDRIGLGKGDLVTFIFQPSA